MNNKDKKEIWIFLSHSNEDYDKVRKVRNMLEDEGLRPIMFFLKCLNDDDEIDDLIKREIDCRTRFILCDSENARNSKWVQREVDYIKNKDKSYEIIDLNKTDEEILAQLKAFRRKSRIYLSYAREYQSLAALIFERLSKYDYDIIFDASCLCFGTLFYKRISLEIQEALNNGYVIALLSELGKSHQFVYEEIKIAIEYQKRHPGTNFIPIFLDDNIPELCSHINGLHFSSSIEDLPNIIVDSLIKTIMNPGEILTYYNNFRSGVNGHKDDKEAERLGKLYFDIAYEKNTENYPTTGMALGFCYENGIGTEIDLKKAYEQYCDMVVNEGIGKEDAERIKQKILREHIYQIDELNHISSQKNNLNDKSTKNGNSTVMKKSVFSRVINFFVKRTNKEN